MTFSLSLVFFVLSLIYWVSFLYYYILAYFFNVISYFIFYLLFIICFFNTRFCFAPFALFCFILFIIRKLKSIALYIWKYYYNKNFITPISSLKKGEIVNFIILPSIKMFINKLIFYMFLKCFLFIFSFSSIVIINYLLLN